MRKILVILIVFISFVSQAQTLDFRSHYKARIHRSFTYAELLSVMDSLKYLGDFPDSTTLSNTYAASSYDRHRAVADDTWFISNGANWNRIGTGAGGGGGDAWSDPVNADIVPDADGTRDIGSTGTRFAEIYTDALDITNNLTLGGTLISSDAVAGDDIGDDQIDSEHYVAGSIDNEHLAANSVDSDNYVDGSIDNEHLAANSVDSDNYVDGSIDLVHMSSNSVDSTKIMVNAVRSGDILNGTILTEDIGADQITGSLIDDDQIDSEHYVSGSIDNEHLAANSVNTTQIVDNAVNGNKIANGTVGRVDITGDAIDGSLIADNAVASEHIADDQIDSEHYVAGSIDNEHLAVNSVDSDNYIDGSIDRIHLSADIIDGTKIEDDAVASEHLADGSVSGGIGGIITDESITNADLAPNSVAGSELTNNSVTNFHISDMAQSTIKGRASGAGTGDPSDLTASQVRTIINVADGANNYVHPNHSGEVTSTGDGATVIASGVVDSDNIADSSVLKIDIADSVLITLKDPIDSTGTVYTARVTNAGRMTFLNNADSTIVTINSDTAFYENSIMMFVQEGAGFVKIVGAGSAVLQGITDGSGDFKTAAQWAVLAAYRRGGTDNWFIYGYSLE